jgi:hypothetical protein
MPQPPTMTNRRAAQFDIRLPQYDIVVDNGESRGSSSNR